MAKTTLVPPDLAAELNDELSRLRAARAMNPKHGTRAGAPRCDDTCQICLAEIQLDLLIGRIPRSSMPDSDGPTGHPIDGIIDSTKWVARAGYHRDGTPDRRAPYTIDEILDVLDGPWGERGPQDH